VTGPSAPALAADAAETFRPYRHLAVRVLARAFRDLEGPGRPEDRESARAFLAGSGLMPLWCRVAAIDPGWVARRAARLHCMSHDGASRFLFQTGDSDGISRPHTIDDGIR
jgi:hypothetical protein